MEQVEQVVTDVAAPAPPPPSPPPPSSTKPPKKQRQKGIAVPKLNLNPVDEDTPSQPLLLPTFQAKSKGKSSLTKIKPISVSSLSVPSAAAAAAEPEHVAPLQQPEGEKQGEESEE